MMWTFLTRKTTLKTRGFHRCTPDTTRGGPSSLCCSLYHRGTRIWSRCCLATSASTGLHPWCQGAGAKDARCHLTAAGQEMPGLRGACQERWTQGYGYEPQMQRSGARRRRLGGGPTKTMGEVKEPSGGYPTNIMGALAMDHSALQGHDCAATLSQEMWTMFRMISDQDLAHPAWRWQCRPLHFATRQQ